MLAALSKDSMARVLSLLSIVYNIVRPPYQTEATVILCFPYIDGSLQDRKLLFVF